MSMIALYVCSSIVAMYVFPFLFNDTAPTEFYTLSLHDALPISLLRNRERYAQGAARVAEEQVAIPAAEPILDAPGLAGFYLRSEEHMSELQSLRHLVCRLLLEKKKEDQNAPYRTSGQRLTTDCP